MELIDLLSKDQGETFMILPKGTVEYSRKSGEDAFNTIIGELKENKVTGYLLILGATRWKDKDAEITGQMVYKEGVPQLCETMISNQSIKGDEGVYPFYKTMMDQGNDVELHTRIDVAPPLAFFKECRVNPENTDPEKHMLRYREELEELRRREEERRLKEAKKEEIRKNVEKWISDGYLFKKYPSVMDSSFEEIDSWYDSVSRSVDNAGDTRIWLDSVKDKELEEKKAEAVSLSFNVEEPEKLQKIVKEIRSQIDLIKDKREEMMKWVSLWKNEGYNTGSIEKVLDADLNTAWNSLTQFMDQIQQLKDMKAELEGIKTREDAKGFEGEIKEIKYLLSDPEEIPSIRSLMDKLVDTINEEKSKKKALMKQAQELKERGFDIQELERNLGKRYSSLLQTYQLLNNNAQRILQIREELARMDRRDIPEAIDHLKEHSDDPLKLDEYEKQLLDMKEKIEEFKNERADILRKIDEFKEKGYITDPVDEKREGRVEQLRSSFKEFRHKVEGLEKIRSEIGKMDRRWLEDEFRSMEERINDTSKVEELKSDLEGLKVTIEERENRRKHVREQMDEWKKEGFNVDKLREVIDGDLPDFSAIHKDMKERMKKAISHLDELNEADTSRFEEEASEVRSKLMDPYQVEKGSEMLETLEKRIFDDTGKRNELRARFVELKNQGFDLEGVSDIIDSAPSELDSRIEEMEEGVSDSRRMEEEVQSLDTLESNWLSGEMDELREQLKRIGDLASARKHFEEFRDKVRSNRERRGSIKEKVKSWKEGGYIMTLLEGKLDNTIEEVEGLYKDFSEKISTLESMQEEFDGMDTSHFRAEAEEIEFKLNDPGLINEIRDEIDQLKEKLNEDRRRRGEYFSKMNEYISQGFTGAEKLKSVMNEDISIIELEFNNFEKEVKMLKKYMESTGFDLNNEKKESRKAENKLEKEKKPKGGEQAEKEEIEGESGAFRCTNCGKRVPADSSECPECGASFEGEVYECPKCHTEVPEGTSVCPGCGAEFEV